MPKKRILNFHMLAFYYMQRSKFRNDMSRSPNLERALEPRIVLESLKVQNLQAAFPSLVKNRIYFLLYSCSALLDYPYILLLRLFPTTRLYTGFSAYSIKRVDRLGETPFFLLINLRKHLICLICLKK